MPTIDVNAKIETWKNKLLDLGKRNRLLNYRETKRSSLKIHTPQCFDLYNSFVENEQPLIFPNIEETQVILPNITSDGDIDDEENDENYYPIKTNQTPKETQRTLKSLRDI